MNNLVNKCCLLIVLTIICKTRQQEDKHNNDNKEQISLLDKIQVFSANIQTNCGGEEALKKVTDFGCSKKAAERWNVDVFKGDVLKLNSDFEGEQRQSYCCAYWDTIKCAADQLMPDCKPEGERYLKEDHPFKEATNKYSTDYYSGSAECSDSGAHRNNYIHFTIIIISVLITTFRNYIKN